MYERVYGDKYNKDLTTVEIATRIREDIKRAVMDKRLPKAKYSVRSQYYSGGSSINIHISGVGFAIMNAARLAHDLNEPNRPLNWQEALLHSPEAAKLLETVELIMNAYNHDGSEIESDYFDVKFYGHVRFDYKEEQKERETYERAVMLSNATPVSLLEEVTE